MLKNIVQVVQKGRYPLDWSKAKWQFFDGSGNELTVDSNATSSTYS